MFIESSKCSPGEAYYESGTETFVGTYDGQPGTFQTTYVFTAKYADCNAFAGEVEGRCQHPFVNGSGTGVFAGIKEARLDMRDDIGAGNFPTEDTCSTNIDVRYALAWFSLLAEQGEAYRTRSNASVITSRRYLSTELIENSPFG